MRARRRNVPVPDELRRDVWYHGTPSEEAADGILHHGLKPGHGSANSKTIRHDIRSLEGAVYLTRDVSEAIKYGAGLLASGYVPDEEYGFVFEFQGHALADVEPDEDYVGAAAWAGFAGDEIREGLESGDDEDGVEAATGMGSFAASLWDKESALCKRIAATAADKLPRVVSDLRIGFDFARHGKKLLPLLSDRDKTSLLKAGVPAAHFGPPLKPSAAWRFRRLPDPERYDGYDAEEWTDEFRIMLEDGAGLRHLDAEKIL